MAIRIDTAFQAVYTHEPDGHTVPALNGAWTLAGLYRRDGIAPVGQRETLIAALYGESNYMSTTLPWVGLYMNADGVSCRLEGKNGTNPAVISGSYSLEQGRDYRLAVDYNGSGTVRMLVDGVVTLTLSFTPNGGAAGQRSAQLGGYGDLENFSDCTLARWRMWSAVLTEAEHRAEYRSAAPVRTSGLLHNWPMNPGASRLDDTVVGQPDMLDNPAAPVSDATTAFVYRPSIVGMPQFFDLGQTTTPGAQSITVPQYAEYVGIHITASDNASAPYGDLSSLVANFIGSFTRANAPVNALAAGGWVATAQVTSSAAGRTFTPTFTEGSPLAGANAWLYFIQDTTGATARGVGQATGSGGTTPGVASATGVANGLAVAMDMHLGASSGVFPANESGWDSPAGTTAQTTGAFGYFSGTRLRTKPIVANGTETATNQDTLGSVISLATWAPKALVNPVRVSTTKAGAWSVRNRVAVTAAGAWRVRNLAAGSRAGAWSVRNLASATRSGAWSVINRITANHAGAWSVRALAAATRAGAWSVRSLASASIAGAWTIRNLASGTLSGGWSVEAPGLVSAVFAGGWSVRSGVSATLGGAWTVRNTASATRTGAWTVRNLASASVAGAWTVRGPRSGAFSGAWSVEQAGIAAGAFSTGWTVRNRVLATHAGGWSLRGSVAASVAGGWSVRNIAAQTVPGAWSVRVFAIGAFPGAWTLEGVVQAFFSGAWSVETDAPIQIEEAFIARPAARNWTARNPRWGSS